MEWREEGYVLGYRPHGETSVVLETLTSERGRCLGYVKGGRGRRSIATIQPGNLVALTWRARTQERLGYFVVELVQDRALAFASRDVVLGFHVASSHLRLLPERQAAPDLYTAFGGFLNEARDRVSTLNLLVRFELAVLASCGFALDLSSCAATGAREDLAYVSPRTGRAVSREAGEPWKAKLLPLPEFLVRGTVETDETQISLAFTTTGWMLQRTLYVQGREKVLPPERETLLAGRHRQGH